MKKKKEKLKDWTIYLWRDDPNFIAAAKIKNNIYGYGFKIERVNKKDSEKKTLYNAKRNAVINVNNTLNVLDMYGKKVVDSTGNIDWKKVEEQERIYSWFGVLQKMRKFPIIEITKQEAFSYKLI